MNHIEAMKQALEALEKLSDAADGFNVSGVYFNEQLWEKECLDKSFAAITSLRQAIEQAEKQEPLKLWLWKNFVDGKPEYWAFDNPFPCISAEGDPLTLGEPCGWAFLKHSVNGRPHCSEQEVINTVTRLATTPPAAPVQEPVATMDDAIAAGDGVLMNEQASLLRECRAALESLIQQKPALAGLLCGSTTLGNLRASLYDYRPKGVFGATPPAAPVQEPVAWIESPHGAIKANPLYKMSAPQSLAWRIPLYTTPQPAVQEPNYKDLFEQMCQQHDMLVDKLKAAQREWVGLTDEEVNNLVDDEDWYNFPKTFARAIEAKLKQKNGYTEEKNT